MMTLSFSIKLISDLNLDIENLESEKKHLIEENIKINKMVSQTQELKEDHEYSSKAIGGVVLFILVVVVISYLGGIDPDNLGRGLNSVADQNSSINNESIAKISDCIHLTGNNIIERIDKLEKVIKSINLENKSWFEVISNQSAKAMSQVTNLDFFRGKKPPTFE